MIFFIFCKVEEGSSLDCNNFGFLYAILVQTNLTAPSTAFYVWRNYGLEMWVRVTKEHCVRVYLNNGLGTPKKGKGEGIG